MKRKGKNKMDERWILDRFEADQAVLTDDTGRNKAIARGLLPLLAKEGTTLIYKDGVYIEDREDTRMRKSRIENKMKELFED